MRSSNVSRHGSRWIAAFGLGLFLTSAFLAVQPALAGDASNNGRSWAILIGVEKYHRVPSLVYTTNDVHQLAATLRTRDGFSEDCLLELTDDATNPRFQPFKANIEAELSAFLQLPGPEDTVMVYFSGHGFRDASGKMYLGPIDCNPEDLSKTGIAVEWFRGQIAGCKAKFKLLVLDSCHAGSEKGDDDSQSVVPTDLGATFKDLEGVVTLASSTAKEKSQIWEEKHQSLFSYWLNQGLRGNADENNDGAVDIDELYKYVYRNVTRTAKARHPLPQTPVRIVRSGTPDVPAIGRLQPLTLRQVLSDMAEQLADTLAERQSTKVGVLEFTNDTKLGELLGADFGLLGRYCAGELERRLADLGEGKFTVVDQRRLQTFLREQGFKLADLGDTAALSQLSQKAGGMPIIALGTLRNRTGRLVNIQCKLLRTDSDEVAGYTGGAASLNESEWGMLGRSVALSPQETSSEPGAATAGSALPSVEPPVIPRMEQKAQGPHPLRDPKFPFPVRLLVGGKERKGVFRGNDYFVPVRKGEVYEIQVDNRSGSTVLMRLLVDGLNTLPEKEVTKGVQTFVVGKQVNLDEARHWELDPAQGTMFAVRGFVTQVGIQGKLREFLVTDADSSLAARQKFTDQIGLITAAFYTPVKRPSEPRPRGTLGTTLGQERNEQLLEGERVKPGNLLAVVHIRYVDAAVLAQ